MRLNSVMRQCGYRLLPQSFRRKASVQVVAWCSCRYSGTANYTCHASAEVRRKGVKWFYISVPGVDGTSTAWARDEACRDLANEMRFKLGCGDRQTGDDPPPDKVKPTTKTVTVRWKGSMKPMPLIKLTGFFKDMDYEAEMTKSGSNEVRFKVTIEEQLERFRSKLRTFLEAHYRIVSASGKSKLNFLIEAQ
jgi:hypothetical protein